MKKILCLLAVLSSLGLCACAIDSQGFYVEKQSAKNDTPVESFVRSQGIVADHGSSTDITGCGTFTEILNRKFAFGRGFAKADLDGTDVLVLSDTLYDIGNGMGAAIDAELYCYKDGAPYYLGYVKSGGSANPLAVMDGKLYAAGHHYIAKITVTDEELVTAEEAWETFDKDGNVTYHYSSDDGGDYSNFKSEMAEPIFYSLFAEYMEADILEFDQVMTAAYPDLSRSGSAAYGESEIYSDADMDEAAAIVKETIAGWDRIELLSLRYGGDEQVTNENLRWMNQLKPGSDYTEVIEMVTDFRTPEDAGGAWEPAAEYRDYQWWLARTAGGAWELLTWGY